MDGGGLLFCVTVGKKAVHVDLWKGESRTLVAACHEMSCSVWVIDPQSTCRPVLEKTLSASKACETQTEREVQPRPFDKADVADDQLEERNEGAFLLCSSFSPCGELIACCSANHIVFVWEMKTGRLKSLLRGHRDSVRVCAFLTRDWLFSGAVDGTVIAWDVNRQRMLFKLHHNSTVSALAVFSSAQNGNSRIICGESDGSISFWDAPGTSYLEVSAEVKQQGEQLEEEGKDEGEDDMSHLVHRIHKMQAHEASVSSISVSWNGRKVVSTCLSGSVKIWNGLSLQEDFKTAVNASLYDIASLETASRGYVPFTDDCIELPDGGASELEDCQNEFRAALLEYQYNSPNGRRQSTAKASSDESQLQVEKVSASKRAVELSTSIQRFSQEGCGLELEQEFFHDASSTWSSFTKNFCSVFNSGREDEGVLFTASEDCSIKVWCAETGQLLFQIKTPEAVSCVTALLVDTAPTQLSQHMIIASCGGRIIAFQTFGLVELQALGEYAQSVVDSTCESFWTHTRRFYALKRGLKACGLSTDWSDRDSLANVLRQGQVVEKLESHSLGRHLCHGSDASAFLRTYVGFREEITHDDIWPRLDSNMRNYDVSAEQMCRALISTSYSCQMVLKVLAFGQADLKRKTGTTPKRLFQLVKLGEPLNGVMSAMGLKPLPPGARNEWGGDSELGMFELPQQPGSFFYYAYFSASSGTTKSGFQDKYSNLANSLYTAPTLDGGGGRLGSEGINQKRGELKHELGSRSRTVTFRDIQYSDDLHEKAMQQRLLLRPSVSSPSPVMPKLGAVVSPVVEDEDEYVIDAFHRRKKNLHRVTCDEDSQRGSGRSVTEAAAAVQLSIETNLRGLQRKPAPIGVLSKSCRSLSPPTSPLESLCSQPLSPRSPFSPPPSLSSPKIRQLK